MLAEMHNGFLKRVKQKTPKTEIGPGDVYRELGMYPGDHLQGADIIRFIEFLVSVTQTRQAAWKILSESVAELKLSFLLETIEPYRARRKKKMQWKHQYKLKDEWEVVVEKTLHGQAVSSGVTCRGKACFRLSVTNRFHGYTDEVGIWEVMIWDREQELLPMRIETLWEVVYTSNVIGRLYLKKSA